VTIIIFKKKYHENKRHNLKHWTMVYYAEPYLSDLAAYPSLLQQL